MHGDTGSCVPSNKSLKKVFVLLCGVTLLIISTGYLRRVVNDKTKGIHDRLHSHHNATEQFNSFPSKETVKYLQRPSKKIFIAFNYWEQLTMATKSFLDLTALAAYGGRQVVVPFAKDSKLFGSPTEKRFETLALYYNVTALNRTLRSRGHGTLISWKEFQDLCQGKLDVLVQFVYTKHSRATWKILPCHIKNAFTGFKITRTICMNVFAVDSVEKFENEVVKRLSCVGLTEWRGIDNRYPFRAQFNLSSVVTHPLHYGDASAFLSSKLVHVARDFITKNLGPFFVSVHIRAEKILKYFSTFRNVTAVENCISNLTTLVQMHRNVNTAHIPVFLGADFTDYGSSSPRIKTAQKTSKSLMKTLSPLKPVLFQPSAYNITDRGAVAIVEMNILVSGKHLFITGGGSFQEWLVDQFLTKNNIDRKATAKCFSKMCNYFCYF